MFAVAYGIKLEDFLPYCTLISFIQCHKDDARKKPKTSSADL